MMQSGGFSSRKRSLTGLSLAFAWMIAAASAAQSARIVAIGDLHGDLEAFETILQATGILDERGAWSDPETVVVQLGDLLDRGAESRAVLDLAMSLDERASAAGGRFVQLLGNHEVMNLIGDLRYVSEEDFARFAGSDAEERRRQAWRDYSEWQRRRAARLNLPVPDLGAETRDGWLASHAPGLVEHREMFAPDGRYGRWLRQRPSLVNLAGTLFVHGGLSPEVADSSLEEIDRRVHDEIAHFDTLRSRLVELDLILPFFNLREMTQAMGVELAVLDRDEKATRRARKRAAQREASEERRRLAEELLAWDSWSIFSATGPLWFRGYSKWTDDELATHAPALLEAFGVDRFAVGHTPQEAGRIRARLGGRVLLVDSGNNTSYVVGGNRSALEIVDGAISAIYADGSREALGRTAPEPASPSEESAASEPAVDQQRARLGRWLDRDGRPLPFATDDEIVEFLASAPVVDDEPIGEGVTRPHRLTLERGGVRIRAAFRTIDEEHRVYRVASGRREVNFRDFYGFEPAAYRLGRLLGIDNIPPATTRTVHGLDGSVQYWIEHARTERRRLDDEIRPPNYLRWLRQIQVMRIWDNLIGNTDRNMGNMIYDPAWDLWMIDHSRAFRTSTDLLEAEKITWCERGLYQRLREVSDQEVRATLDGLLVAGEIRALLERRTALVRLLESLIQDRGEGAVLFTWAE